MLVTPQKSGMARARIQPAVAAGEPGLLSHLLPPMIIPKAAHEALAVLCFGGCALALLRELVQPLLLLLLAQVQPGHRREEAGGGQKKQQIRPRRRRKRRRRRSGSRGRRRRRRRRRSGWTSCATKASERRRKKKTANVSFVVFGIFTGGRKWARSRGSSATTAGSTRAPTMLDFCGVTSARARSSSHFDRKAPKKLSYAGKESARRNK